MQSVSVGADDACLAGFAKRKKSAIAAHMPSVDPCSRNASLEPTAAIENSKELASRLSLQGSAQPDGLAFSHPQDVQQAPQVELKALPNGHATPVGGDFRTASTDSQSLPGALNLTNDRLNSELRIKTEPAKADAEDASVDTPTTADDPGTAKQNDLPDADLLAANVQSTVPQEERSDPTQSTFKAQLYLPKSMTPV